MNIVQERIRTFQFSDRLIDLFLLFLSARGAIVIERLLHSKSWHALDPQSFHFNTLIVIFIIWIILIQIFENDLVYRRTPVWDIIQNTALISFVGVTSTISLNFLLKASLFHPSTILFFGVISFILLLFKRGGMKYILSSIRQEGFDPKNILIIGFGSFGWMLSLMSGNIRSLFCPISVHDQVSSSFDTSPFSIKRYTFDRYIERGNWQCTEDQKKLMLTYSENMIGETNVNEHS